MTQTQQFDATQMLHDLEGGTFAQVVSAAVHQVAKSVTEHGGKKQGTVTIELKMSRIGESTSQVQIEHGLKYRELTAKGDVTENRVTSTPMHVGAKGVTFFPENQMDWVDNATQPAHQEG